MSGINNYFSNNNIFNGTEIPTQGKFDVGDIIVNIGENAEEEPMWMCIEAGEPGVWKVVGKVEEMDLSGLLTENKDLVGAINELFQSANNGKQLIANAIGEPVSAEDTFSAMSNDINGLLSTFKTNMMNNGITVESNDKFKSLIDKIATMVEEGEGKGIRFETINVTSSSNKIYFIKSQSGNQALGYNAASLEYNDLKFPPTFIIITYLEKICGVIYNISGDYNVFAPEASSWIYYQLNANEFTSVGSTYYSVRANNNGFKVPVTYTSTLYTCYAIGVGEEDTTLRDSLANILQEEGVSVTEDDDMASLITKVDEEFDRKNANSGLDIISATELPVTGRENQICVITDNPVDIFRITPNVDYTSNDGNEIVVYTGTPYTSGLHSGYFLASGLDNNITEYYFDKIIQNSERKNSYIYINSTWEQMTKAYISWLENGIFMNSELFGGHTNNLWFTINSEGITFKPDTSFTTNIGIATTNRIDFTVYNKVSLKITTNNLAGNLYLMAVDSITRLDNDASETSLSNLTSYAGTKHQSNISLKANDTLYYDIDISGWSGNYYLAIVYSSSKVNGFNTNYNINIIDVLVY